MVESKTIKKLYIIYILEILRKFSDEEHQLSQADIINYMYSEYNVTCERKSIARNIGDLQDLGYEIEHSKGYYLNTREFQDSELRLLIDSVLASRHIPERQAEDLINKLIDQSNIYFRQKVKHVCNIKRMDHENNNQLFYNIDVLCKAIVKGSKVEFYYNYYNRNKEWIHTCSTKHCVNPYQIVIANGKYYLISNIDKRDNSTYFRIERISDITITEQPIKPKSEVKDFDNGFDLPKHMLEHVYMFSGKSVPVTLKVEGDNLSDVIDWLGTDIDIKFDGDGAIVNVWVNEQAMKYWALQYGGRVTVLQPQSLRNEIRDALNNILSNYGEDD